jgi:hypothetical protein
MADVSIRAVRDRALSLLGASDNDVWGPRDVANQLARDVLALADENERLHLRLYEKWGDFENALDDYTIEQLLDIAEGYGDEGWHHLTEAMSKYERAVAEAPALREALQAITLLPRGHDCYGHCHRMKDLARAALVAGREPT